MAEINVGLRPFVRFVKSNVGPALAKMQFHAYKKSPVKNPGKLVLSTSADTNGLFSEKLTVRKDYIRQISYYTNGGVPLIVHSQKDYAKIKGQCEKIWGEPVLIVSNGGAFACDAFGREIVNEKIDEEAVTAICSVLQSKELEKVGAVSIGSHYGTFLRNSQNISGRVKEKTDPGVYGQISDKKFFDALDQVNNLCFVAFRGREYEIHSLRVGIGRIGEYFGMKRGHTGVTFNFTLPVLKNPFRKKILTDVDNKAQEKAMDKALIALLNADPSVKQKYLDKVDVVMTASGLSFVPRGASKIKAIETYCQKRGLNPETIIHHGDNFDDFFRPVSLREIDKFRNKAISYGKPFDVLETVEELSKSNFESDIDFSCQEQTFMLNTNKTRGAEALRKRLGQMEQKRNVHDIEEQKDEEKEKQAKSLSITRAYKLRELKDLCDAKMMSAATEEERAKILEEFDEQKKQLDEMIQKKFDQAVQNIDKRTVEDLIKKEKETGKQLLFHVSSNDGGMSTLRKNFESLSSCVYHNFVQICQEEQNNDGPTL